MSVEDERYEPGDRLSATQVNMWLQCPRRWAFRYLSSLFGGRRTQLLAAEPRMSKMQSWQGWHECLSDLCVAGNGTPTGLTELPGAFGKTAWESS